MSCESDIHSPPLRQETEGVSTAKTVPSHSNSLHAQLGTDVLDSFLNNGVSHVHIVLAQEICGVKGDVVRGGNTIKEVRRDGKKSGTSETVGKTVK